MHYTLAISGLFARPFKERGSSLLVGSIVSSRHPLLDLLVPVKFPILILADDHHLHAGVGD